ncbi:MAG: peptidoglycan DD-metalloendopeptidase family protein, partial [Bdellovibrionota bacterium]
GGGLYSVYRNVKDFKVRKGEKVQGGQLIATANAGSQKQPVGLDWGVYLSGNEINPEKFLQTSTQLCDSK